MVQLGATIDITNYDEPRGLDIFLEPRKVNLISNPSFETNGNLWTTNSSKTLVSSVPTGVPGTQSLTTKWYQRFICNNHMCYFINLQNI
jgi:hypothetical protein